jgi:hypothetical protein
MASYSIEASLDAMVSRSLETLQAEGLRLTPADRAKLLDRLVASLAMASTDKRPSRVDVISVML